MQITVTIDKKRLFLVCDGAFYREVDLGLFRKKIPRVHLVADEQERDRWFYLIEKEVALKFALFLLQNQDYLSTRLEEKLYYKKISSQVVQEVVANLKSLGYLEDRRFIKRLIEREMAKGKGVYWIRAKLISLKIDPHQYENELYMGQGQGQQKERIGALIAKMAKRGWDFRKIAAALYRRGFSKDEVGAFMASFLEEADAKSPHSLDI